MAPVTLSHSKSDDSSADVNSAATAGVARMKSLIRSLQSAIRSVIPSKTQPAACEDFAVRHIITLDPQAFDDLVAFLDSPPRVPPPEVKARFARKPVWED